MIQLAAYGRLGHTLREITTSTGKTMAVASIAVTLSDPRGEERTQRLGIVAFGRAPDAAKRRATC